SPQCEPAAYAAGNRGETSARGGGNGSGPGAWPDERHAVACGDAGGSDPAGDAGGRAGHIGVPGRHTDPGNHPQLRAQDPHRGLPDGRAGAVDDGAAHRLRPLALPPDPDDRGLGGGRVAEYTHHLLAALLVSLRLVPTLAFAGPFTLFRIPPMVRVLVALPLSLWLVSGRPEA